MPTERAIAAQRVQWYRRCAAENDVERLINSALYFEDSYATLADHATWLTYREAREAAHYALLALALEGGEDSADD